MALAAVVLSVLLLVFAATSGLLGRAYVSAPMAFVVAGALLSQVVTVTDAETFVEPLTVLAELTLALLLFHDAAHIRPRQLGAESGPALRLLLVGLPLTVGLGYLTARLLLPDLPPAMALLLAAALACTDAGLGAATVLNPVVPVHVRRLLNLESGLNDGLATPVVLLAIAVLAGAEGLGPGETLGDAVVDLVLGCLVGVAAGLLGGRLLQWSADVGAGVATVRPLGVLALPVLAFFAADLLGGNTFVAAFVAGTAFAGVTTWSEPAATPLSLVQSLSDPLGFSVWLTFGLVATPLVLTEVGPREVGFAVLALTALRMGPVALALLGTGLRAPTVAFVGWFGPRGLASVVFALLAVEALEADTALRRAVATVAVTVLLSVLAHGLSADVLAARYGAWVARVRPAAECRPAVEPLPRGSMLHRRRTVAG